MMEDGEGRMINFKNTIILFTTNVGSDLIMNLCKDPELQPDADGMAKALRQPMRITPDAAALMGVALGPSKRIPRRTSREMNHSRVSDDSTRGERTSRINHRSNHLTRLFFSLYEKGRVNFFSITSWH
jgi:hypothetical protein